MIPKFVALQPLRGGSKSIPKKNIKLLAGKPLFYWSLKSALDSGIFERIYVSTDCNEIAECVRKHLGHQVEILMRDSHLATDTSSTEDVMLDFAEHHNFGVLCLIQATSPLTEPADFLRARIQFETEHADSLVTTVPCKRFFWAANGDPQNYDPAARPRRQDFTGTLMENGAFYYTRKELLLRTKCRLGGKISVYRMDESHAVEIDEPADWHIIDAKMRRRNIATYELSQIKALLVDVDGTLTDGGMYYSAEGECVKKFDTRDAHGMKTLERLGVKIGVITAESSAVVTARMAKLQVSHYFHGIRDKVPVLKEFCQKHGLELHQVAYIGDDHGDLEVLTQVGFAACPADAQPEIKAVAHYISDKPGGSGAVRDVCNLILAAWKTS